MYVASHGLIFDAAQWPFNDISRDEGSQQIGLAGVSLANQFTYTPLHNAAIDADSLAVRPHTTTRSITLV